MDLYNAYNIIINLKLKSLNLPLSVLPYSETAYRIQNISALISDENLRDSCFLNTYVNDDVKKLLSFANKKLELLILLLKLNKEGKSKIFFSKSKKAMGECNLIGQSSAQIMLILKELQNNGLYDHYRMQNDISSEINSLSAYL